MFFRKKDKKEDPAAAGTDSESTGAAAPAAPPTFPIAENGAAKAPEVDDGEPPKADLAQVSTTATQDIVYPEGFKLALLLLSVFVSMFLVSLVSLQHHEQITCFPARHHSPTTP